MMRWSHVARTAFTVFAAVASGEDVVTESNDSSCEHPSWVSDGECNDETNVMECSFDGGDCCGDNVDTRDCDECECKDDTGKYAVNSIFSGGCPFPTWLDDGECDDETNNAECDWDGGDCCDPESNLDYCNVCECVNERALSESSVCEDVPVNGEECHFPFVHNGVMYDHCASTDYGFMKWCATSVGEDHSVLTWAACQPCAGECQYPSWINDGVCDDESNTEICLWDGGDCCKASASFDECNECRCYQSQVDPTAEDTPDMCHYVYLVGDGLCDDGANTAICGWDGGDCCLEPLNNTFCEDCLCFNSLILEGRGPCKDTDGFVDAYGDGCSEWEGYDCGYDAQLGYTYDEMANIQAGCVETCGLCPVAASPTSASTDSSSASTDSSSASTDSSSFLRMEHIYVQLLSFIISLAVALAVGRSVWARRFHYQRVSAIDLAPETCDNVSSAVGLDASSSGAPGDEKGSIHAGISEPAREQGALHLDALPEQLVVPSASAPAFEENHLDTPHVIPAHVVGVEVLGAMDGQSASGRGLVDELRILSDMHASGTLSSTEYTQAKGRILSQSY